MTNQRQSKPRGSGTAPNWKEVVATARRLSWADTLPQELDCIVLSLGCTLARDEKSLATSSIVSAEQGARTYLSHKLAGDKVRLVEVGAGYFDASARGEFIEGPLMAKHLLSHPQFAQKIPGEDLFVEPYSFNTPCNALCVGLALQHRSIRTAYLVSDPLHSKRAEQTFREVWTLLEIGTAIVPIPAPKPVYGNSNKWFLRHELTWRAWNRAGILALPGNVEAIKKALATA